MFGIYASIPDNIKELIIDTDVISGYGCRSNDPEDGCRTIDNRGSDHGISPAFRISE